MINHIPRAVAMVRPARFGFNVQTAGNNAFQNEIDHFTAEQIQEIALLEFNNMVRVLKEHGIHVHVFDDHEDHGTPDSIFPNNWFSTFGKEILLYPMYSTNRQQERKPSIYNMISALSGKGINSELLAFESKDQYLEGTGSLVLDHSKRIAYAALSPRTSHEALDAFERISGYRTVRFEAMGPDNQAIYHTNVMMTMADDYCILGADTILSKDRNRVLDALKESGKDIIYLENKQVYFHFAGNMLQLSNEMDQKFLIMSSEAHRSLKAEQLKQIADHGNQIIAVPINLIERIGGGSARCMMAEFFSIHEEN